MSALSALSTKKGGKIISSEIGERRVMGSENQLSSYWRTKGVKRRPEIVKRGEVQSSATKRGFLLGSSTCENSPSLKRITRNSLQR